jgi:hypothetical protein
MFGARRYRNYEVHRLANGPSVVGFVTSLDADRLLDSGSDVVQILLFPDAEGHASTIVAIGYDRIVHHRQYSIRNAEALTLHVSRTAHLVGA